MTRIAPLLTALLASACLVATPGHAGAIRHHHATPVAPGAAKPGAGADVPADTIVAVVNGDAITNADVESREKLFALSSGLPIEPGLLARLRPQITRQLIDEKLKMAEIQRRKIVVTPDDISNAIASIESRNGMPAHALETRLTAGGASLQTLIDQLRVQIGWTHVLRENLGERTRIAPTEIKTREQALREETGQPEYDVSEIFIPIDDPTHAEEADRFAQAVIQQLHQGAPFAIVAAQFGQDQSALDGGALGWVQSERLDPQVVDVVRTMPEGAVSNPIRVAGGYDIITLHGKRTVGNQLVTELTIRQAFFPFATKLDPSHPTPQQQAQLERARGLAGARSCDAVEAANKAAGGSKPADPGPLVLSQMNPQMAALLSPVAVGSTTKPLVSLEGIVVIGVCSREQKNIASQSSEQIADTLLSERVELASRQENRDLHRRAVIEMRSS